MTARRRTPYQDTDAWRAERRTGYGASDAPILIEGDEAAWRQLHGEKLGLLPDRIATESMDLGKRLEDVIARAAAERLGERLTRVNRLIRHPDLPHVFASLDRRRRGGRPVEIKKWAWKGDDFGPPGSDIVPVRWLYQVQQQAAVTGADAVDIWVLFGGSKLEQFSVGRDQSMIDEILELETAAWAYVARGEIPPWPGQAPQRIVLAADEIAVDDVLRNLVELHEVADVAKKAAEQELKDAKDRLRAALAAVGAARGVMADGRRVSIAHRPSKPGSETDWSLVARAYRKVIEGELKLIEDGDMATTALPTVPGWLDSIVATFTIATAPSRPLRVTIGRAEKAVA